MQSLCFFNNKGGVGKTTLATNIASFIATKHQKRVLIVDLDPQCNTTQLLLNEERQAKLFTEETDQTAMGVVKPLDFGESAIKPSVPLIEPADNNFGMHLLPGHPSLSLFEDTLSQSWLELQAGKPAGLKRSLWVAQLCELYKDRFDLIVFDVGPSFGALNRTVLLGCDYFVSPLGCDLFSIIGIENIGKWLTTNQMTLAKGLNEISERESAETLEEYGLGRRSNQFSKFLGYTVLQYITKSKGGERRPTEAFERFRKRIPDVIAKSLESHFAPGLGLDQLELGDVPNMYSIVPLAQYAQKPVHLLGKADGLAGAAFGQHKAYVKFIEALAGEINGNLDTVAR